MAQKSIEDAAIEEAMEAQKQACAEVVLRKRDSIKKAYYGLGTWNMIVVILDQVIADILDL